MTIANINYHKFKITFNSTRDAFSYSNSIVPRDAEYENYYETFDNYEEFAEKYTIIKIGDVYESYIY